MPIAPRLPGIREIDRAEGYPGDLGARALAEGLRFTGTCSALDLTDAVLDECALDGVSIEECILRGLRISESAIAALNAPVLAAPQSQWRDVSLERSRIGSAELHGSELTGVSIAGSKLGYLNLRAASLTDVTFDGCTIDELDLARATASRVSLRGCSIGTLDVTGATLTDVDLRGAEFEKVNGIAGLKGATLDGFQLSLFALLLATELGIRVED